MPQMAPMWWMTMMIMFIIALIVCIDLMYFNYKKKINKKMKMNMKNLNWMW